MGLLGILTVLTVVILHVFSKGIVSTVVRLQNITRFLPQRLDNTADIAWPDSRIMELHDLCGNFQEMAVSLHERQDALRESQRHAAFLSDLVESSSQPFAIRGLDGGLGFFNAAYHDMLGYTREELEALHFIPRFTHPEWKDKEEVYLQEILRTGQPLRYEKEYLHKNGSRLPAELFVHLRRAESGQPLYYGFITDITARKQAETALQRSEERFRKIFENAATGIAITDLQGRFHQCNPAYCAILGYTEEELYELDFASLIHPEDREANLAQNLLLERGDLPFFEVENRYFHKNGQEVWVHKFISVLPDSAGKPTHLMALVTDITARKQAEEALRMSEARERERAAELQGVLDAAPSPIFIAYTPDVQHMIGNPAAYDLLRLPVGSNVSKDAPEEERPDYKAVKSGRELLSQELPLQRAIAGEVVQNFEFELVLTDGTVRQVSANSVPLFNELGAPRGGVTVLTDLTAYKKSQEALRRAHGELEQRVKDRTAELRATVTQLQEEVTERQQAEQALRESEQTLRYLATRILTAQENERKRIAMDLHEGLAQSLVTLKLFLRAFQKHLPANENSIKEDFDSAHNLILAMVDEVRRISQGLTPMLLENLA